MTRRPSWNSIATWWTAVWIVIFVASRLDPTEIRYSPLIHEAHHVDRTLQDFMPTLPCTMLTQAAGQHDGNEGMSGLLVGGPQESYFAGFGIQVVRDGARCLIPLYGRVTRQDLIVSTAGALQALRDLIDPSPYVAEPNILDDPPVAGHFYYELDGVGRGRASVRAFAHRRDPTMLVIRYDIYEMHSRYGPRTPWWP